MSKGGGVLNPGKLLCPKEEEFSIQGNCLVQRRWSSQSRETVMSKGGGVLNPGKLSSPKEVEFSI